MPTKKANNGRGLTDVAKDLSTITTATNAAAALEVAEMLETGTPVSTVGDSVYAIERRLLATLNDVRQIRGQMATDAPDDGTGSYTVGGSGGGGGGGGDTGPTQTGTPPSSPAFAGFIGSDVAVSFSVSDGTWSANTHADDTYFPDFASVCNINGGTEPCTITLTFTCPAAGTYDVFLDSAKYPTGSVVLLTYPDAQTESLDSTGDNVEHYGEQIGTSVVFPNGTTTITFEITSANPSPSLALSKLYLKLHGA